MTFGKYFERQIEWWWSHVTAMISLELIAILKTGIKIFIHCEFEENGAKDNFFSSFQIPTVLRDRLPFLNKLT